MCNHYAASGEWRTRKAFGVTLILAVGCLGLVGCNQGGADFDSGIVKIEEIKAMCTQAAATVPSLKDAVFIHNPSFEGRSVTCHYRTYGEREDLTFHAACGRPEAACVENVVVEKYPYPEKFEAHPLPRPRDGQHARP